MRGFANYVMSGRLPAATMAVLFGLIPGFVLISGAIVVLVTLRRGIAEGLQIMLWALLPALLLLRLGDPSTVLLLVGALLVSWVLRVTQRWQSASIALIGYGLLCQISLRFQQAYLERMRTVLAELIANGLPAQAAVNGEVTPLTADMLLASYSQNYGMFQMLLLLGALVLGRYWQAALYNPGGFRQEFHNLRFDMRLMALLLILIGAGSYGVAPLSEWLLVFTVPPLLNGLAVIHKLVALRASAWGISGTGLIVSAYVLLPIAAIAYVVLGFADSVFDFRKRWSV